MQNAVRVFLLGLLCYSKSYSQIGLANQLLSGSIQDAKAYTQEYLKPVAYLLAHSGGNSGSFAPSDSHLSFEIDCNAIWIPQQYKDFNIQDVGLRDFEITSNNFPAIAQTIAGSGQQLTLQTKAKYREPISTSPYYIEKPIAKLDTPKGFNLSILTQPFLKLSYRWKNYSFQLRGFPKITNHELESSLYSFGFFAEKKLEWNSNNCITISSGMQKTNFSYNPTIYPDSALLSISTSFFPVNYDKQQLLLQSSSIPMEIGWQHTLGKKWSTGLSLAYVLGNAKVALRGNYPLYFSDNSNLFQVIIANISNPFSYSQTFNHARANFRLGYVSEYFFTTLHYSYSEFQSAHLGFGIKI